MTKPTPRIACLTIGSASHFASVKSIVRELRLAGATLCVWTDEAFKSELAEEGIGFQNLYAYGTPDHYDPETRPRSARLTAFSVQCFEQVLADVKDWAPDLILVEGFTLIGKLIAEALGIRWILLNSSHIPNGRVYRHLVEKDFPKYFSEQCLQAVDTLKTRFGMINASPFDYIVDPGAGGTIHFEPPQWPDYTGSGHTDVHYWGSGVAATITPRRDRLAAKKKLSLYAAFGTMVWRYWADNAYTALSALARLCEAEHFELIIGLGGSDAAYRMCKNLANPSVKIMLSARQMTELETHDIFVTHNGLNSTHEAVRKRIPMLSLPFAGDQNSLAIQCQRYGLGLTIQGQMGATSNIPAPEAFTSALEIVQNDYSGFQDRFETALAWEAQAIHSRPHIVASILTKR